MGAVKLIDGHGRTHWQPELATGERMFERIDIPIVDWRHRYNWGTKDQYRHAPSVRPVLNRFRWMSLVDAWTERRRREKQAKKAHWNRLANTLTEIQHGRRVS